jgi:hypothetical protein
MVVTSLQLLNRGALNCDAYIAMQMRKARWLVFALLGAIGLFIAMFQAIDIENRRADCEIAKTQFRVCD